MSESGEQPRFITGRRVHDPVYAAQEQARRQHITDALHYFAEGLPLGETGEALDAVAYQQPDGLTCFYAALGGIATSLHGRVVDIHAIGARARSEGLLGQYGAETFNQYQEAQREFVRREMNVGIRFINTLQDPDQERIDALTSGLRGGTPLIFGLPRHWIALDGFRKFSKEQTTYTGMNPSGARRIESEPRGFITPQVAAGRLIEGDMPVVVVEGADRRRFPGSAAVSAPIASPRRIRRVEATSPQFGPGRRIRRVN